MFQPKTGWMRWLSLAMLLALSIAISNLSPRCGFAGEKPTGDTDTTKETKAERAPFDLTYLPPDAMGVVAIRPSAIFGDPAMKLLANILNEACAQARQSLKLSEKPKFSIEDIEEAIAPIHIVPGDKKHGRNHSLVAGLAMIRVTHDFDWLNLMRQLDPKTEEVRQGDRVYYRSNCPFLGPKPINYFMPDSRTVAFLQEKTLSTFVKGQSIQRPHFSWDADWKRVEHGRFAVAMDNHWAKGLSKEQIASDPEWASLSQNVATMVAGMDWKDGVALQAYLRGNDRAACDQIEKDIKAKLKQMRRYTDELPKDVSEDERQEYVFDAQWTKDLCDHARIERCETTVRVHTLAKIDLAEFVRLCTKETKRQPK